MLNKTLPISLVVALSLLTSACQLTKNHTTPDPEVQPLPTSVSGPWLEHKKSLENLSEYQASGKFAFISKNKTNAANFAWFQRSNNEYRLLLTTPFGNRIIELNSTPGVTQLTDDKNRIYFNSDAQTLIYELTGMHIPLDNLRQWLIGLPGQSTEYRLDKHYRLSQLEFEDRGLKWQVKYLGYDTDSKPALPDSLELYQNDQKIKIKVNSWELK